MTIHVRQARATDAAAWAEMRQLLWSTAGDDHEREIAAFFQERDPSAEVLLAVDDSGRALGFAELSIRSHAEACLTRNVAYLEGWFVREEARGKGVAKALVSAAEEWGRSRGCREFASDTNIENHHSVAIHKALGFEEVDRIVCFRKALVLAAAIVSIAAVTVGCTRGGRGAATALPPEAADRGLTDFIATVQAVDNHSHVSSTAPSDTEYDALPLEGIPPFALPARARPDSPVWLPALRALYGYEHRDMSADHLAQLRDAIARLKKEQGDRFPEWVLDRAGIEVMLANRIAMGPGLAAPRFRWVSYVDALMLPLSTRAEAAATPDRTALFPLEDKLLRRYLDDLRIAKLPPALDDYLRLVVTPTLERQRQAGAVAVKFEAAYLRPLAFDDVPRDAAARTYARYVNGGEPGHAEYKALQDFLFRYIAREAGRLGLAVHIHAFEGAGSFYDVAGSDPLLLESVVDTPELRSTTFVIVHGGGIFAPHTAGLLAKPNVFADTSIMSILYTPEALANILFEWLSQYPEKVLFGTDASGFGPELGWEVAACLGAATARQSLGLALTRLMNAGEVDRGHAEQIATMVLRTNAAKLYKLPLK
jgi:predicted TIM-barrel fold metal-dependent hydrolase/GNAT superfamily N-acetyltransferase